MKIMVIKFEQGYRLVRNHKCIELWLYGMKLRDFTTWTAAIQHLDELSGKTVKTEMISIG